MNDKKQPTDKRVSHEKRAPRDKNSHMERRTKRETREVEDDGTLIEGRNAVLELLRSDRAVDKLFLASGMGSRMQDVFALAKSKGITIQECDRRKLDSMSITHSHQGVIAQAAAHEYAELDDLFAKAESLGEEPLFVVLDGIEDPHNLGAIIRSAESAGAHGVIIPKRRASGLTAVAARASAGALEHILVHKATNLAQTVELLKERGVWIFGAEADGTVPLYEADFKGATAIVIGSEGLGISRIIKDKCDFVVSIPMRGKVNSLNASNAAAVLLYEAVRRRVQ